MVRQDVRAFRAAVLEGKVAAPVSMAMRAALSEAKTVTDMSANEKLAKSGEGQHRRRGRDDLGSGNHSVALPRAHGGKLPNPKRVSYTVEESKQWE